MFELMIRFEGDDATTQSVGLFHSYNAANNARALFVAHSPYAEGACLWIIHLAGVR